MVICMQCGSQNRKENKKCSSCGAPMPHFEMTPTVKVEVVTGRFKKFHDNVEGVRNGQISPEAFGEFLQDQYETLQKFRGEIAEVIEGTDYLEKCHDEMTQGIAGMDHYEEGVHEMWAYLEDGDVEHLEAGLEMIRMGNDCINDAMRINRMARKQLEEEWGTM
ncbi:MAG: hypothetical protein Q4F00_05185 [bacterium]|nr:hypothetical protein [bacterium]